MLLEPCGRGRRLVPFLHEARQAGYLCTVSTIAINSRYNVWCWVSKVAEPPTFDSGIIHRSIWCEFFHSPQHCQSVKHFL